MNKPEALKVAFEIVEECKSRPNDCLGCPYLVKHGKFADDCMVSDHIEGVPSRWILNEMLGDEYL